MDTMYRVKQIEPIFLNLVEETLYSITLILYINCNDLPTYQLIIGNKNKERGIDGLTET